MSYFVTPTNLINDLRNAAYISAAITVFFILIEVPIVIIYILSRFILTFIFTCLGMVLSHLIIMLWNKVTSTPKEASTNA